MANSIRCVVRLLSLCIAFVIVIGRVDCLKDDNPLVFSTHNCYITEPVYGQKFNFTDLRSDNAHKATNQHGDIHVEYNICGGSLMNSCDGRRDVAACLRRGTEEHILGTQHQLNYRNGKMYFSYTNGSACPHGSGQYQLHVFLDCDYTVDQYPSRVTEYANETCTYYVKLETPAACLPEPSAVKSNTCSVKDPNSEYTYNLMPLSDVNYRITDLKGSFFIINVCKPVLYGEFTMCPPGSSICRQKTNETDYHKRFSNYGTVQANPIIENNRLLMRHPSTTPCNATHNYTSTIHFYCDQNVKNPHPVLIGNHGCTYEFSFVTPLACSKLSPCTAMLHHNKVLNLTSLQGESFTLDLQNTSYTFGICGNAGAPCLENDGACAAKASQATSLGRSNSLLLTNQSGSAYLLYESGATCKKSTAATAGTGAASSTPTMATTNWSTKIEFVCANNTRASKNSAKATATAVGPKIIENSNCQLLIHYQTELACPEQISCQAKAYVEGTDDSATSEVLLDLTPLMSATENYEAIIDASVERTQIAAKTKFFLNVCRPLVPKYGLGCPGGSSACMATVGQSTPENEQSLGYPLVTPVARNRTNAALLYSNGGICTSDRNSQLSSGIEFYCDVRAGRGRPVLKSINDCHYQFVWPTNVICPPHECKFAATACSIINEATNVHYDLRAASFTQKGSIQIGSGSAHFEINICGTEPKVLTDYTQDLVNLFFSAPGPCGVDGLVNVQLSLICSEKTERATSFSDDTQCNLVYTQRTPDICKFLGLNLDVQPTQAPTKAPPDTGNSIVTAKPDATDASPSDKTSAGASGKKTGSVGIVLGTILAVTCFVVCLGLLASSPARRNSLRRCFRRRSSAVRYSRVQSAEEANLLIEPNGQFTDSDDDMLL